MFLSQLLHFAPSTLASNRWWLSCPRSWSWRGSSGVLVLVCLSPGYCEHLRGELVGRRALPPHSLFLPLPTFLSKHVCKAIKCDFGKIGKISVCALCRRFPLGMVLMRRWGSVCSREMHAEVFRGSMLWCLWLDFQPFGKTEACECINRERRNQRTKG